MDLRGGSSSPTCEEEDCPRLLKLSIRDFFVVFWGVVWKELGDVGDELLRHSS